MANVKKIAVIKSHGSLRNYKTGDFIRPATAKELQASKRAAKNDGGSGVVVVDAVPCYVSQP